MISNCQDLLLMEIPSMPEPVMSTDGSGERLMITSIEVENFKSYFGRHVLGPFHHVSFSIHQSLSSKISPFTKSIHESGLCRLTSQLIASSYNRLYDHYFIIVDLINKSKMMVIIIVSTFPNNYSYCHPFSHCCYYLLLVSLLLVLLLMLPKLLLILLIWIMFIMFY